MMPATMPSIRSVDFFFHGLMLPAVSVAMKSIPRIR